VYHTDPAADFKLSIEKLSIDQLEELRQGLVVTGSRLKIKIVEDLLKERLNSPEPELAKYPDHALEGMIQGARVAKSNLLVRRLQRELENRAKANSLTGGIVQFSLKELVQSADLAYRETCRGRSPSLGELLAVEAGKWHEWAKLGHLWHNVKSELISNWSNNVSRE
jgi:hypothetical protein